MTEYPDHFVRRLEILWGDGFLSPGGPAEVREILRGIAVEGRRVLDIGCGIGGPDVVIARDLGAAQVTACDVDEALLERARRTASKAGVADRVTFRRISPGRLPFEDASLDLVFSKEAFLHVGDKAALFADILRVLRPGGVLAASDWLRGAGCESSPEWTAYQQLATYTIVPASSEECRDLLQQAGFIHVSTRDRNAWYADLAAEQLALIEGPLREQLIAASSPAIYEGWVRMRRAQTAAVKAGAMRPTHLRGVKP